MVDFIIAMAAIVVASNILVQFLILDGAMGTMVQGLALSEADVRAERFQNHSKDLKNFVDILCLTRPDDVTTPSAVA